jgi:serine/threonine-protein kinase HipA
MTAIPSVRDLEASLRLIDALGSKDRFSKVQERHWQWFAEVAGLSWAQTRKRVIRMTAQLPSMARRLQAEVIGRDQVLISSFANLIGQRRDLTLRRFTAG